MFCDISLVNLCISVKMMMVIEVVVIKTHWVKLDQSQFFSLLFLSRLILWG